MTCVETLSTPAPMRAPATGIIFPKFTTPFSPNFVTNLNPTARLILVRTSLGSFFNIPCINFSATTIPAFLAISATVVPVSAAYTKV